MACTPLPPHLIRGGGEVYPLQVLGHMILRLHISSNASYRLVWARPVTQWKTPLGMNFRCPPHYTIVRHHADLSLSQDDGPSQGDIFLAMAKSSWRLS